MTKPRITRALAFPLVGLLALLAASSDVAAALAVYVPPETLAARAELIVEGRVVRAASGFDPATATLATYVTVDVATVYKGSPDLETVTFREPGGRFGRLVHDVDAVPVYVPGEEVMVFLEPAPDGALRTAGMFLGKFEIGRPARGPDEARRRLGGEGRLVRGGPAGEVERMPLADLAAVAVTAPPPSRDGWLAVPPEWGRLRWDDVREASSGEGGVAAFVALEPDSPTRWTEADQGLPVRLDVQLEGNPLDDPLAAAEQLRRAMGAWTAVAESRVAFELGQNVDFHAAHDRSPAVSYSGARIVLFDDPYEDISDPLDCSGVLAVGGYWRSEESGGVVNGISFSRAVQAYVIFNDGFECYLGDGDRLAEIAAHELGHVLGFGHSERPDSLMRAYPYGLGRGPRLGDDDVDAAHCHYPHRLTVLEPGLSSVWEPGASGTVAWRSTEEVGPDRGTLSIELSSDGGQTWTLLAADVANDGFHQVRVPEEGSGAARLRLVRYNRVQPPPYPYPEACTIASSAPFSIAAAGETDPVGDETRARRRLRAMRWVQRMLHWWFLR